jgi:hypothetical protein
MDDGAGGDYREVLSTIGYTSQLDSYLATNLTASLQYRFVLEAYNYNLLAPGQRSLPASVFACSLPTFPDRPSKVATTQESILIDWTQPLDNGGCSI